MGSTWRAFVGLESSIQTVFWLPSEGLLLLQHSGGYTGSSHPPTPGGMVYDQSGVHPWFKPVKLVNPGTFAEVTGKEMNPMEEVTESPDLLSTTM